MDNDSGALILLIVLIVSAFLLIVLKLAQFSNHFSREKQYLLTEMHRAADYNEYRYWRRELRCLYLCLIPFVTERNVMKVYPAFFHRAKHATKEKRSDGLMHILAPSMLAICICAICLCGASWAWFTASSGVGAAKVQAATYAVKIERETDPDVWQESEYQISLAGGKTEVSGDYPGWSYNPHSVVKDTILRVYRELFGKEATVEAVHAGIECGLFADSIQDLDCVSIGPDMGDVHTPREHLSISSSARTYQLLCKVLQESK